MFGIGPMELMAILVVALLVFGPKRIPELAQTLGRGLAEFRRASNDLRQSLALDELQRDLRKDPAEKQTIHRPGDRPAQAGDDVEIPDKGDKDEKQAVSEGAPPDSVASSDSHPGELPLGEEHDFEHRAAGDTDDVGDAGAVGQKISTNEEESKSSPDPSTRHANQPADSELGNVPVSSTKPTDPRRG